MPRGSAAAVRRKEEEAVRKEDDSVRGGGGCSREDPGPVCRATAEVKNEAPEEHRRGRSLAARGRNNGTGSPLKKTSRGLEYKARWVGGTSVRLTFRQVNGYSQQSLIKIYIVGTQASPCH